MNTHPILLPPLAVRFAASGCLALLLLAQALTVSAGDIDIRLTARRVTAAADGREVLQPADRAFPGDIVQYSAIYQNRAARAVSNLQPTLPIPAGMEYIPDSAKPAPAQASLDGRRFEPLPLKRKVLLPDGQSREEEVSPSEYRALRWAVGDLPAAGRTNVVARTRIVPATPAPTLSQR